MESRTWRNIASFKSAVAFPNLHVYKGNLTMFGTGSTMEIYNGVTWEVSSEPLGKIFSRGSSVKVPCHQEPNSYFCMHCFKYNNSSLLHALRCKCNQCSVM